VEEKRGVERKERGVKSRITAILQNVSSFRSNKKDRRQAMTVKHASAKAELSSGKGLKQIDPSLIPLP